MKKLLVPLLALLLLVSCELGGNFTETIGDALKLATKFKAGNCNISSVVSTDGNSLEVTLTNVDGGDYAELSDERFTSCVAYEYAQLTPDSVLDNFGRVTISISDQTKDGIVTTTVTKAQETYSKGDMERMDSLYRICVDYIHMAQAEKTFLTSKQFRDTALMSDSGMTGLDSSAPAILNDKTTEVFYGYQHDQSESKDCVWVRVNDEREWNVIRFIFLTESGKIVGMSLND